MIQRCWCRARLGPGEERKVKRSKSGCSNGLMVAGWSHHCTRYSSLSQDIVSVLRNHTILSSDSYSHCPDTMDQYRSDFIEWDSFKIGHQNHQSFFEPQSPVRIKSPTTSTTTEPGIPSNVGDILVDDVDSFRNILRSKDKIKSMKPPKKRKPIPKKKRKKVRKNVRRQGGGRAPFMRSLLEVLSRPGRNLGKLMRNMMGFFQRY